MTLESRTTFQVGRALAVALLALFVLGLATSSASATDTGGTHDGWESVVAPPAEASLTGAHDGWESRFASPGSGPGIVLHDGWETRVAPDGNALAPVLHDSWESRFGTQPVQPAPAPVSNPGPQIDPQLAMAGAFAAVLALGTLMLVRTRRRPARTLR